MCQLRRIQKEKLNRTMFRSEKSDLYERLAEETEEMDHKIIRKE